MLNWLKSKELPIYIILALTVKSIAVSPNMSDAIIFIAASAVYSFSLFLKNKTEPSINENLKREIAELKSSVTALSIRPPTAKPQSTGRMF